MGHQGVSGVYCEAGRNSRYSGARRGIGASGALGVPMGCRGHQRVSGVYCEAGRDSRYSGARRGIGAFRGS